MDEELGELVLRLSGDMAEMKAMWEEAADVTEEAAGEVVDAADEIEGASENAGESFAEMAGQALAAAGAVALLKEGFNNFAEAEGILIRLTALVNSNVNAVEGTIGVYQEWAANIEQTTRMEDDAALSLLAMAETFGATGAAATKAAEDAIAFAAVFQGSAESYVGLAAAVERGDVATARMLARGVRPLRGIADDAAFLAKAQQLIATGMQTEQALMASSSGQLQVLSRDWGNLLEELGAFVAQGVVPVVRWLREATAWFRQLGPEVRQTIVWVTGATAAFLALGPAIALVKLLLLGLFANPLVLAIGAVIAAVVLFKNELFGGVDIFLMLEYGATSFRRVWDVAVASVALRLSELGDTAAELLSTISFGALGSEGASGATRVLSDDLDRLSRDLVGGFEAFRRVRAMALGPPGNPPPPVDPFADAATSVAQIRDDLREIGSFDAALSGTAEALSRVAEYADRTRSGGNSGYTQAQFSAVRGAFQGVAPALGALGGSGNAVIAQLVDVLNRLANRPGAVLAPAEVR